MSGKKARNVKSGGTGRGSKSIVTVNTDVPSENDNKLVGGELVSPHQGVLSQDQNQTRGGVLLPEEVVLRQLIKDTVGTVIDAKLNDALFGAESPASVQPQQPLMAQARAPNLLEWHKHFMTLDPPKFEGSTDPLVAHQWLKYMEKVFKTFDYPEEFKLRFASFQLDGDAYDWWEAHTRDMDTTEITWTQFREMFFDKYFPRSSRVALEKKFQDLRQKDDQTVVEYEREFSRLATHALRFVPTEQRKIDKFVEGLNYSIAKYIIGNPGFDTFNKVVECARVHDLYNREAKGKKTEKAKYKTIDWHEQKNDEGQPGKNWNDRNNWKRQRTEDTYTGAI